MCKMLCNARCKCSMQHQHHPHSHSSSGAAPGPAHKVAAGVAAEAVRAPGGFNYDGMIDQVSSRLGRTQSHCFG